MRSDENVKQKKRDEGALGEFGETSPRNSFSGGERDNLFLSDGGKQFHDVGGLAGLDDSGDGRATALLDYDRDGWVDLVVASSTVPTLQLYRNRIGDALAPTDAGRMVAVRLVGGNRADEAAPEWSSRDGYGALVRVDLGDGLDPLLREHRCGDGRAAQGSTTMIIGVGESATIDLSIRWPAGQTQERAGIPAGKLVTVFENPSDAPGADAFVLTDYRQDAGAPNVSQRRRGDALAITLPRDDNVPRMNLLTAMSTHCVSCKKAQPQIAMLRDALRGDGVAVFGIPIDLDETPEELEAYVAERQPAYEVLSRLPLAERRAVKEHITATFLDEITPATIVTDADGTILATMQGVPTISAVRRILHSH